MRLKINYSLLKVKANKLTKSQSLNFDKSAAVAVNLWELKSFFPSKQAVGIFLVFEMCVSVSLLVLYILYRYLLRVHLFSWKQIFSVFTLILCNTLLAYKRKVKVVWIKRKSLLSSDRLKHNINVSTRTYLKNGTRKSHQLKELFCI